MNHQWIDTDGDCSCLNCDFNWTPERDKGWCIDLTDPLDRLIYHKPMSLERVDTALMLGDCVAVCMNDESLRTWYRDGMQFIEKLNEAEVLEQHTPEVETEVSSLINYAV